MPDGPIRYLTLSYGDEPAIYRQSLMLLLSLLAHAPDPYEIVVATEHPERYVWFGTRVEIEYVSAERLAGWRREYGFSMRQKLELMRAMFPGQGALVLLDADVIATRSLVPFVERLLQGDIFMHKREYVLGRTRRPGHRRLWKQIRGRTFGTWEAQPDDGMWNSGVLAVGPGDRGLIHESLRLYDAMAEAGIRHPVTEQLAEGLVLGRTGRLHPAEPWFAHYWGNKAGFDAAIARRLADAFVDGLSVKDAAAALRTSPIDLPPEVRPGRFEKLRQWMSIRESPSGPRRR